MRVGNGNQYHLQCETNSIFLTTSLHDINGVGGCLAKKNFLFFLIYVTFFQNFIFKLLCEDNITKIWENHPLQKKWPSLAQIDLCWKMSVDWLILVHVGRFHGDVI